MKTEKKSNPGKTKNRNIFFLIDNRILLCIYKYLNQVKEKYVICHLKFLVNFATDSFI